jgi:hypothetical protein
MFSYTYLSKEYTWEKGLFMEKSQPYLEIILIYINS